MININIYDGAPQGATVRKEGLSIKVCEWSQEAILFDGDVPLCTVTVSGLHDLYVMYAYNKHDDKINRAIDMVADWLD